MRQQELDIEFSDLAIVEEQSSAKSAVEIKAQSPSETTMKWSRDQSQWFFRECADPQQIAKEKLYSDWVSQFFPQLILERRTVYKMRDGEKVPVGSCWKKFFPVDKKPLEFPLKRLIDFNVPLAFAVLFFLNQSYSCVNTYSINLVDAYLIDRFKFENETDEDIVCRNNFLIRSVDVEDKHFLEFIGKEESYSLLQKPYKEFSKDYFYALLHIVLMPSQGWDPLFCEKQAKLRAYLLDFNGFEILNELSSQELLVRIQLFCRQFSDYNSKAFFDYRNTVVKNYCIFLLEVFLKKIKKNPDEFLASIKSADVRDLVGMDERTFHAQIVKSIMGKMYLKTIAGLSSEFSFEYFSQSLMILTVLKNCILMCPVEYNQIASLAVLKSCIFTRSVEYNEIVSLAVFFGKISEVAVGLGQLNLAAKEGGEFLEVNLNRFSKPDFAQACIDWLKQIETNNLKDLLLNKNLLMYIYQRTIAQFKGSQPTSYPRFLSAVQTALPEGVELLYQKMDLEQDSDQLCVHLFELIKIAPIDFWNLFLRQLAVVVFCETQIVGFSSMSLVSESQCSYDIQMLLNTVKVSPEALIQLNANFKAALMKQIKDFHDWQTAGFRSSGSSVMFSDVALSRSVSTQHQEMATGTAPSSSVWGYVSTIGSWFSKK